jgi:hypothetical protein
VISNIAEWPAHDDTTIGEAYYLAPFVDTNNDGDYPEIKGDQAIYFIYNDAFSAAMFNSMTTETHVMAYAFQCPDSAIQNTIFVDYRVYNRSNNTYDSTYVGMWSDFDIGNAQDDYVQCDVTRSLFYGFNEDLFDDDNSGRPGYGYHLLSQGV